VPDLESSVTEVKPPRNCRRQDVVIPREEWVIFCHLDDDKLLIFISRGGDAKGNGAYPLDSTEMKAKALEMPALEKHARKGGMVTESAAEGGSTKMC
jgi:hypothetical protein